MTGGVEIPANVLWSRLGAIPEAGGVRFTVWAPLASRVDVVLEGTTREPVPLRAAGVGVFSGLVPDLQPGALYRITVDGRGPFPDPASRFQPDGVHGPSQIVDASAFMWSDAAWRGRVLEQLVLYELHVGTFTPAGTFAAAIEKLPHLVALGVTALEIMPVAEFPGDRNWGYDGAALWAPSRRYGTPDDFRRLVDAAHAHDLAVHLDVVYNHLGPDGAYVAAVAPPILARRKGNTGWGTGLDFDGDASAGVRAFLIANAIHWVCEYHLDGLRLDATAAILDTSPRHFLAELATSIRAAMSEKPVVVIAEDARNLATLMRPEAQGGTGLDGTWSFDFHHQIHRILTGDRHGYFADFGDAIEDLATIVRQGWLYTGQHSHYANGPRGEPATDLTPAQCVFYLQNHDEVGNPAAGVRLHHVISPAAYRAAVTLLLIAPQTPLLFMGQEWAASTPFPFFTDHSETLGARVAEGRRREYTEFLQFVGAAHGALAARMQRPATSTDTVAAMPHPQHLATFELGRLRWDEIASREHASVLALHRALLGLRRDEPALRRALPARVAAMGPGALLLRRESPGHPSIVAVLQLVGSGAIEVAGSEIAKGLEQVAWHVELDTEQQEFAPDPAPIAIAPDRTVVFQRPGAVVFRVG